MLAIITLRSPTHTTYAAVSVPHETHEGNFAAFQSAALHVGPEFSVNGAVFPTKAITLRQPWGWAIAEAGKDIENRSRKMARPGWYFLHVGKGGNEKEYAAAVEFMTRPRIGEPGIPKAATLEIPTFEQCQRGGVIGIMKLGPWVKASNSRWFVGPLGAPIEHFIPLPFCPGPGSQGVFQWEHKAF